MLSGLVCACSVLQPTTPTPTPVFAEIAGVIQAKTPVAGGLAYALADGRTFIADTEASYIGGQQPQVGELLLAGSKPTPWVYRLRLQPEQPGVIPAACYLIDGDVRANADHVFANVHDAEFGDFVVAYPKTPDWRDDGVLQQGSDLLRGTHTCIDQQGRAFFHF